MVCSREAAACAVGSGLLLLWASALLLLTPVCTGSTAILGLCCGWDCLPVYTGARSYKSSHGCMYISFCIVQRHLYLAFQCRWLYYNQWCLTSVWWHIQDSEERSLLVADGFNPVWSECLHVILFSADCMNDMLQCSWILLCSGGRIRTISCLGGRVCNIKWTMATSTR